MLYLKLDSASWNHGDFSTESKITGTIYTDRSFTTPKDLSDFTLFIRLFKRWHRTDFFNKQASVVSGINGTFEYAVNQGDMPHPQLYLMEIELNKLGVVESTKPVEFHVKPSPSP